MRAPEAPPRPPLPARLTRALRSSRGVVALSDAWQPLLLGAGFLFLLVDLLLHGAVLHADVRAHALSAVPRSPTTESAALLLDRIGLRQTTVPPVVVVAVLLGRRRRSWQPVLVVSAALLALTFVVGVLKLGLGRGDAVNGDPSFLVGGQGFPSGHSSNIALACALLVHLVSSWRGRRVRLRAAAVAVGLPCAVMSGVSLFLGFHWLSDLLAGVLVGLLVAWAAVRVDAHLDRHADAERARVRRLARRLTGRLAAPAQHRHAPVGAPDAPVDRPGVPTPHRAAPAGRPGPARRTPAPGPPPPTARCTAAGPAAAAPSRPPSLVPGGRCAPVPTVRNR